jgi:hypothetical protein
VWSWLEQPGVLARLRALEPYRTSRSTPREMTRLLRLICYPDGGRYAVAVFTRSLPPIAVLPQADAVIGTATRLAVEWLR